MSGVPGSRAGIFCAGTILVDVAKVIDAYPALDHLATIEQVSLSTGGPGLNMAVDLRMLGAAFPIGVFGAVGDEPMRVIARDGGAADFPPRPDVLDVSTAHLRAPGARLLHATASAPQRAQPRLHTNMELVSIEPGRIAEVALPCLPADASSSTNGRRAPRCYPADRRAKRRAPAGSSVIQCSRSTARTAKAGRASGTVAAQLL